MKTTYLLISALLVSSVGVAQKIKETEVPAPVMSSFHNNFKNIKAEKWEKENGNYEAEFDINKVETSATFTADGKLLETETEISSNALPETVTAYVAKNYAGYKTVEAAKIVEGGGKVKYEAEMKKGKVQFDLLFDEGGNFIEKKTDRD
jgi:hypothetical protein